MPNVKLGINSYSYLNEFVYFDKFNANEKKQFYKVKYMSKYPGALAILMDMGFPLTQLSKAKFVSGVRVCISIRDQRERLCTSAEGLQNPFAKRKTVTFVTVGSPALSWGLKNNLNLNTTENLLYYLKKFIRKCRNSAIDSYTSLNARWRSFF